MLNHTMKDAEYFALDRASNSTLSKMKRSAAHCKANIDEPMTATPAMAFGTLVHCLVLEPLSFSERYYIAEDSDPPAPRGAAVKSAIASIIAGDFNSCFYVPDGPRVKKPAGMALAIAEQLIDDKPITNFTTDLDVNRRTKEGKEQYAQFVDHCTAGNITICKLEHIETAVAYADEIAVIGERAVLTEKDCLTAKNYASYLGYIDNKTVISEDDLARGHAAAQSVMDHPRAAALLTGGQPEVVALWDDPDTEYPCKAKIDYIASNGYLVDLKTTADASLDEFSRSIGKFGYHRQQAMYRDGFEYATGEPAKGFVFVAVENKPPYAVGVYILDDESESKGREEYTEYLSKFADCKTSGDWPSYSNDVEIINLPTWYK